MPSDRMQVRPFKNQIIMIAVLEMLLILPISLSQNQDSFIVLKLEDFNDQDIFNNFSGDWNKWDNSPGSVDWLFDTANHLGDSGACLRVNYSVPNGGYGGIWMSLSGKIDYLDHYLDFEDLYGELQNSPWNPSNIDNVSVSKFTFWAKGNGSGSFNHVVKVEFKDIYDNVAEKYFTIPNSTSWNRYEFNVAEMNGIELNSVKQVVFVISDYLNDYRTSHLFLDDLCFGPNESEYNAASWSDDQFLDLVEHRAFKYFYCNTDQLGFALDRSTFSDLVSIGAIGFQLAAYCIGHQRGWADNMESRVEDILTNLYDLPMGPQSGRNKSRIQGILLSLFECKYWNAKEH